MSIVRTVPGPRPATATRWKIATDTAARNLSPSSTRKRAVGCPPDPSVIPISTNGEDEGDATESADGVADGTTVGVTTAKG